MGWQLLQKKLLFCCGGGGVHIQDVLGQLTPSFFLKELFYHVEISLGDHGH